MLTVWASVRSGKEGPTKSGKPRELPIVPKLGAELAKWKTDGAPHATDTDLVCPPPARVGEVSALSFLPMSKPTPPIAIPAAFAPARLKPSIYPAVFAARVAGREKRPLGDLFGLRAFGVNLTRLVPGAQSALRHVHTVQDEFIYILAGAPTLITDAGETPLGPGDCVGFPAGGTAHHLINRSSAAVVYLEVGDRARGDSATYPDDDLKLALNEDGTFRCLHKDGTPY